MTQPYANGRSRGAGVHLHPRLVAEVWKAASRRTPSSLTELYSPELFLRRPPARNARYRLDNMLKAAAERGVKVNVIVYKEVPQALTRKSKPWT